MTGPHRVSWWVYAQVAGCFARIGVHCEYDAHFISKHTLKPHLIPSFRKSSFSNQKKTKLIMTQGPIPHFQTHLHKPIFEAVNFCRRVGSWIFVVHKSSWHLARNGKHWTNQYLEACKRRSPVAGHTPAISWEKNECGYLKKIKSWSRSFDTVWMSFVQSRTINQRLLVNLGIN